MKKLLPILLSFVVTWDITTDSPPCKVTREHDVYTDTMITEKECRHVKHMVKEFQTYKQARDFVKEGPGCAPTRILISDIPNDFRGMGGCYEGSLFAQYPRVDHYKITDPTGKVRLETY